MSKEENERAVLDVVEQLDRVMVLYPGTELAVIAKNAIDEIELLRKVAYECPA